MKTDIIGQHCLSLPTSHCRTTWEISGPYCYKILIKVGTLSLKHNQDSISKGKMEMSTG